MQIKTLLVANRGEIAARIIRTCQRLGIRAIAVYSEADRYAPHVALADSAVLIGPAESAQSYLKADSIIAAARRCGADAIHPGYGFLSENEALISACEDAGIIFVGPHREAIRLMGSKIESKNLAEQAGVATIPGYHEADQSEAALVAAAENIGFPLMIKASAGGGGRGMRRIDNREQFIAELPQARQEAQAGFADDSVLLEKLITAPRHIEVQVAADKQGKVVHLFERECSIQRNHQKIIEEAPAAFLSEAQRQGLYDDAVKLARAIGYDSLGTVEFLLDDDTGETYFLEMNTRLQVEHPVTESITGLDLVEWQIRIAGGEPLPHEQADIQAVGWAIEARVNAENPADNYRPETGTITCYREPVGERIRVDSGVKEGSEVTPHYDPMLAKVIGQGADRDQARATLVQALETFTLTGLGTNLNFLADILRQDAFGAKALTTNYLAEQFGEGWQAGNTDELTLIAATLARIHPRDATDAGHVSPWRSLGGFRLLDRAGVSSRTRTILATTASDIMLIESTVINSSTHQGDYLIRLPEAEQAHPVAVRWLNDSQLQIEVDGLAHILVVEAGADQVVVHRGGQGQSFNYLDERQYALRGNSDSGQGGRLVIATLPGQVVEMRVAVGDQVQAGDTVAVLDSMKLLHNLVAEIDGSVAEIFCAVSDSVEGGAPLVELTPAEAT